MSEELLDTRDLSDAEYLALIEVAKLWQFKTFRVGGICRKSDMEAWLTEHYHLSNYTGHIIANKLTETFNPRDFDIDLTRLAGLSDNRQLRKRAERAEAALVMAIRLLETYGLPIPDDVRAILEAWKGGEE